MTEKVFLKKSYIGADQEEFRVEFIQYLENILTSTRFDAMSDYALFLHGGKKMLEEIIFELKGGFHD